MRCVDYAASEIEGKVAEQSPGLRFCQDMLPADGLYLARDVEVLWDQRGPDGERGVRNLTVAYLPRGTVALQRAGFREARRTYCNRWFYTAGNSFVEWMRHPFRTPEALFALLLIRGFADAHEIARAINEFGRIRECDWARRMRAVEDPPDLSI